MPFIRSLNKKLKKMFNDQVAAHEEGGCLVLSGQLARWNDVVHAGMVAIEKSPFSCFVNDIECVNEKPMPVRKTRIEDSALEWEEPDVLIIGGGIIGCAIARELSRYKLSVLLVEKEHDVAMQASGRNAGIVYSGLGIKKGSNRHLFARRGNQMYENLCEELEVDFVRSGQFLYASKRLWDSFIFFISLYWKWMGIKGLKIVRRDELHRYEPSISNNIAAALHLPEAGVVNPFDLTIAYAENAVDNGINISLNTMVQSMVTEDGIIKSVQTNRGTIKPKVVVNAAGVFCESIASMAGDRFYSIHPRKGTIAILDKKYKNELVQTIISSFGKTPSKKTHTKESSIVRTANESILIGPVSIETIHKEDYSTASLNLKELFSSQARIVPKLSEEQVITYFSGISAATYDDEFIVRKGRFVSNIVHAAGIQTPGLTAAPAISVDVAEIVLDFFGGESSVGTNPEFNPKRIAPQRLATMDDNARAELIESNPDYGIILCRCEEISKGEVVNALRRSLKCETIDGVKRRVRAGMGCCHGSFCTPQVLEVISSEKRLTPQNVRKSGSGSEKLYGSTKALLQKKASTFDLTSREGKTDSETIAKLHKLQAAKEKRKDSIDDGSE